MRLDRPMARALAFLVRNWPLKLAAATLATLLYVGVVASQDAQLLPVRVPISPEGLPADVHLLTTLGDVQAVRYVAPVGVLPPAADSLRATVNLAGIEPGEPALVRVNVVPDDPRVTILAVEPATISVVLDRIEERLVPVVVERSPVPPGIEIGETFVEPATVTVSGPQSIVSRVDHVRAAVVIQPSGINFSGDVELVPVDANNEALAPLDVEPATAQVRINVFTDRQSRTVVVSPTITGTPAAGFEIAAVDVSPATVTVTGDAEDLESLERADTAPISVAGATRDLTVRVGFALPEGVEAVAVTTVEVTVTIRPVTATRTFSAGIRLDGARPGFEYALSQSSVLVTVFGSVAELDTLASTPLFVGLSVGGLDPGTHEVTISPVIPASLRFVEAAPATVSVIVTGPAAVASPSPSAAP